MRITRFRSVWGIDSGDNLDNWANWFPDLKKQGYGEQLTVKILVGLSLLMVISRQLALK